MANQQFQQTKTKLFKTATLSLKLALFLCCIPWIIPKAWSISINWDGVENCNFSSFINNGSCGQLPTNIILTQTAPTCTGNSPNNNGKITLTAVTNADKFGVSAGGTYSGPNYAAATTIGTLPQDVQTGIPNAGGTYTIRLFNGANDCFKDTTVTIASVSCFPTPVIAKSQVLCGGVKAKPLSLTNSITTSGTISYQWQSNTSGCAGAFANIAGAQSTTYQPPANLSQTTYYRLLVTVQEGSNVYALTSNCISVSIGDQLQSPVCNGVKKPFIDCSTFLGGDSWDDITDMAVVNGEIYVVGVTYSTDFPVTDGSTKGAGSDVFLTKFDANCNIVYSKYFGGNGGDYDAKVHVSNGKVVVMFLTNSTNLPVTDGSVIAGNIDLAIFSLDAATGNLLNGKYWGGTEGDHISKVDKSGDFIYLSLGTYSDNLPVTDGSAKYADTYAIDFALMKVDVNGNVLFSKYLGPSDVEFFISDIDIAPNGDIVVGTVSHASFPNFPVTSGGTVSDPTASSYTVVTRLDANGNVIYSKTASESTIIPEESSVSVIANNDAAYMYQPQVNADLSSTTDGTSTSEFAYFSIYLTRLDVNGNLAYATNIKGHSGKAVTLGNDLGIFLMVDQTMNVTTTDGTQAEVGNSLYFVKLNQSGIVNLATIIANLGFYGGINTIDIHGNELHVLGSGNSTSFPTTNGSSFSGGARDIFAMGTDWSGKIKYSTYLGGVGSEYVVAGLYKDGSIYISSPQNLGFGGTPNTFPVTTLSQPAPTNAFTQTSVTKLSFCTAYPKPAMDTLSPSSQSVCINGVVNEIKGGFVGVGGLDLPIIYRNNVPSLEPNIETTYQWQTATSPTGPWEDIPGAVMQDYTPQPVSTNRYFRRLSLGCDCCLISVSEVAAVTFNGLNAPTANAGGIINTCVGTGVALGGSPVASGGAGPYTILWDNGLGNVAHPVVSPIVPTVYTLKITDSNGCVDYDQAIVNPYKAFAGLDVSNCAGAGVRIGGDPIPGLAGVTYGWTASPADPTMSCTNCAQPNVNPATTTTYTLTLGIPVTGGGTCSTTDGVVVTPVAPPATANFAGPDRVICLGQTANLGTAPESGFNYTWAPGNYLTSNNTSNTVYQPGSLSMPTPNPGLYYLTARKGTCSFVDEVRTAVIEARAGVDGCGPRNVGEPDRTPNINETYSWTKISGPGNFVGPTNLPIVPVSASIGGPTVYRLTVSYTLNGVTNSCVDEVVVPECGCVVDIKVEAPFACPSFGLNNGDVKLIAVAGDIFSNDPNLFSYSWSPAAGLSSTTGRIVTLTDNVHRTYTVTMTSPFAPGFQCTRSIEVNHPAWSLPVFSALDTVICPGQPVAIGEPFVAGYAYKWSGTPLSSSTVSNPIATPLATTNYLVTVTDVGSGCITKDTATVTVAAPLANAGPDRLVCDGAPVTLGTPAQPNTTYQWSPSAGITYLDGTSSTSAQPKFVVAVTSTYTVVATNTLSGCTASDQVTVTVGTPVTPFTLPDIPYCPGGGAVTLNPGGIPSGMTSYKWSPASMVASPNNATTNTLNPPPNGGMTYNLTVKNSSGCEYTAPQKIVPNITPPATAGNQTVCYSPNPAFNGSVQIGGAAEAGATYSWSPTTGLNNPNIANPTFTPTAAGAPITFTVTKNKSGCNTTATVTVTIKSLTLPVFSHPTVCQGTEVQIGAVGQSGVSYYWTPTTGLSDPNAPNPFVTANATTTYNLLAIDGNGCAASQSVTVGVHPEPSPDISIPNVTACLGDPDVQFQPLVTPPASYLYQWSPNNGTLTQPYSLNTNVILTTAGVFNYNLKVTNSGNGCSNSETAQLEVTSCPCPSAGTGSSVTICGSETNTIDLYGLLFGYDTGGTWTRTGGVGGTFNAAAGTFTPSLGATTSTFVYTVSGPEPCVQNSATVTVVIIPQPAITLTQTAPTCTGNTPNNNGKITLTAVTNADKFGVSAGGTYSGPNYAAATTIGTLPQDVQTGIPNAGGTYTIRLFNGANYCYKDTTVTVAVSIPPTIGSATVLPATCTGQTPSNNASITITGINNGDKADISQGNYYSGGGYAAASGTVSGGSVTFSNLPNPNIFSYYTVRVFSNGNSCYKDTVLILTETYCPALADPCDNQLGGKVYIDADLDGVRDANETTGQKGVIVHVYDCDGALVATDTTDLYGDWHVNPTLNYPVRVEFSHISASGSAALQGTNSLSNTQFVNAASCNVNFGVGFAVDYCTTADPTLVVPCYENGAAAPPNNYPALVSFPASYSGVPIQYQSRYPFMPGYENNPAKDAGFHEIGTVWGVAHQAHSDRIFLSSVLRRHSGLGPQGLGGIYLYQYTDGVPGGTPIGSINLQGVNGIDLGSVTRNTVSGPISGDFDLSTNHLQPSIDLDAFAKVGKVGFGGIDFSDPNTLWAVNLNQRSLIKLDASSSDPAAIQNSAVQYLIDGLPGLPGCPSTPPPVRTEPYRIKGESAARYYKDSKGNLWAPTYLYGNYTGSPYYNTPNTQNWQFYDLGGYDNEIYQKIFRGDTVRLEVKVPKDCYDVTVHLISIRATQSLEKVRIELEGSSHGVFNIYALGGDTSAVRLSFSNIPVSDGVFNIRLFDTQVQNGTLPYQVKLAGVEIFPKNTCLPATTPPDPNVLRPWALKFKNGEGYLGVTCTGEGSNNLSDVKSYVLKFDPENLASGFETMVEIPMNYNREWDLVVGYLDSKSWNAWLDDWNDIETPTWTNRGTSVNHPQPILSDIEFTKDGSMAVAVMSRFDLQGGYYQYPAISGFNHVAVKPYPIVMSAAGDVLHFCYVNGNYVAEGAAGCATGDIGLANSPTALANDGLVGNGEYYYHDYYVRYAPSAPTQPTGGHNETGYGSLAYACSNGYLYHARLDPIVFDTFPGQGLATTQGVTAYNPANGQYVSGYLLIDRPTANPTDSLIMNFGKGLALGDMEPLCSAAPKQIGNYVWWDEDKDGVQDACETPISGVTVTLYKMDSGGTVQVATTTTNANGNYLFTDYDEHGGFDTLETGKMYFIVIGEGGQFNTSTGQLSIGGVKYQLTPQNTGEGVNPDLNDSDGYLYTLAGKPFTGYPVDTITVGGAGFVNHKLDFGFMQSCTQPSAITLTQTAPTCTGATPNNNGKITLTAVTNADKFGVSAGGTYSGPNYAAATTIGTLPQDVQTGIPNAGGTYTIRLFNGADDCFKDTTVTVAPVTCCFVNPNITGTTTICPGASTTLTASGGSTYLWSTGATSAAITVSPPATTSYTVTITGVGGCTAVASKVVVVDVLACPCEISQTPPVVGCCYRDAGGVARVQVSSTITWGNIAPGSQLQISAGGQHVYYTVPTSSGSRAFTFEVAAGSNGTFSALVVGNTTCSVSANYTTTNDCSTLALANNTNQVKIVAPSHLSACNTDTVRVYITNLLGDKNPYPDPMLLCLALPGNGQVTYAGSSFYSIPSGATTTATDGATSLHFTVPFPELGKTTVLVFAVNSSCDVAEIAQTSLPRISGLATYPATFPVAAEAVFSQQINAASANLIIVPDASLNKTVLKGSTFQRCLKIRNGGYGNLDNFNLFDVSDAGLSFVSATVQTNGNAPIVPTQTVSGGQIIYKYELSGVNLGSDKYLTAGEEIIVCANFTVNDCGNYNSKFVADYACPTGAPACQKSDTMSVLTRVQAGTPILSSAMVSFQQPNGCPNRHVKYRIFNSGTSAGFPESYAFDALFKLYMGNTNDLTISNVTLNGASATYSIAYNQFIFDPKQFTADPDGAGGLSDLDGDGYFDDIAPGDQVFVDFDYTFSCSQLCGNSVFRNITATNTFTDYCFVLNGSTATNIGSFGFRQLSPISQTNVNFTCQGNGEYDTQCVTFGFDFEAVNFDLTNASARINIFYSKKMTFEGGAKFNGVAKTPTIQGDSLAYFDLTPAEFSQLLTAGRDSIEYCLKLHCNDQRNTKVTNHYQILVSLGQGACASPCQVDLACKKHLAYGYNPCCGGVTYPCWTTEHDNYRVNTGWAEPAEINDSLAVHDRLWVGDTVRHYVKFYSNNYQDMDPFGVYPGSFFYQAIGYGLSTYNKYVGNINPFIFQSGQFNLRKKSDNSLIKSMTILLEDFVTNPYGNSLTGVTNFAGTTNYYSDNCANYNGGLWFCFGHNNFSELFFYENHYTKTLVADSTLQGYYMHISLLKGMQREGYYFNPTDTSFYMETDVKFLLNPDFPWDNVASVSSYGLPVGDVAGPAPNDYLSYCNEVNDNFTVAVHKKYISNPGAVYSPDCGLTVHHEMEFEGFNGDYFTPGEYRFPLRIDSIVVDLPAEYGLVAGTYSFKYHQNCTPGIVTTVVPSATTGHIVWTHPGGFPKSDDCAGYQHPYKLQYNVVKIGSAAPTTYSVPVKIYGKGPHNEPLIFNDLYRISEAQPALVVTPSIPIQQITDGGNCTGFYTEFKICNPSSYDAANVYLAIEDVNNTQIRWVQDVGAAFDPITAADTSRYGSGNLFVKLGAVPAHTCRTVRIGHRSNICSDSIRVYADMGCQYPSPLQPNLSSPNLSVAYAKYEAVLPTVQMKAADIAPVQNLCDDVVLEYEISNAKLPNLYNMQSTATLPANMEYVVGSAQYRYPTTGAWTNFPGGAATVSGNVLTLNFSGIAALNTACGLPGTDEFPNNRIGVRFSLNYTDCPSQNPQQVFLTTSGKNFCQAPTQAIYAATINYQGDVSSQKINNYTVTNTNAVLRLCSAGGVPTTLQDTLVVKNLGGHGSASGVSSGKDTMSIVLADAPALYSIANVAAVSAGWGTPWTTTDLNGNTVLHAVIPAGIPVGSSASFIFKYDLTAVADGLCASAGHPICYLTSFRTVIPLACPATNLDCNAGVLSLGNSTILRALKCCKMEIGDYVWLDNNKNGLQNSGEPALSGIQVALFNMAGTQIATTVTDASGKYFFRDHSATGGLDTLAPNTMYFVVITDARFSAATGLLKWNNQYFELTTPNASPDTDDSDATTAAPGKPFDGKPNIGLTTGAADFSDLTFDFGFRCITPFIGGNQTICSGDTLTRVAYPSATILTDSIRGVWTSPTVAGLTRTFITSATNDSIVSVRWINTTANPIVTTLHFQTPNGCATNVTITVNPTPVVTVPPDHFICVGETHHANFWSPVSGTTFTWVNSNPAIGLAASGSGNIPPFVATNTGSSPISAQITVTPTANGCTGVPKVFTITVNPLPNFTGAIITPSTCSGVTANDDGSIQITGITNADKADISIGTTYTGPIYKFATGTVSGGSVTFSNLPNPTADQTYTIRIFNLSDACYKDTTVTLPAVTCCTIADADPQMTCHDNGTSLPDDDYFTLTLNPTGVGTGATYSVSGDITANNVPYGSPQEVGGNIPISVGKITINITDDASPGCELVGILLSAPDPCSPPCDAPDLTADDQEVCSPFTVNLTTAWTDNNPSTTGSGTVTYHASAADAAANTNPISGIGIAVSGNYWVRKTMSQSDCFDTVRVTVTIIPKPNAGADVVLDCPFGGGNAPSTYHLGQAGFWSVFLQPAGAAASVDNNGQVSGMTVPGNYVFRLSVVGNSTICHDDVQITVPTCCPVPQCIPLKISKY